MSPQVQCQTCFLAPPASESEDPAASDDEPESSPSPPSSQPTASQHDHEEAGPSGIAPTSSWSSHSKKSDKTFNTVDEAIKSMIRTMKENEDLKKTISIFVHIFKSI